MKQITIDTRLITASGIGVYLKSLLPKLLSQAGNDMSFRLLGQPELLHQYAASGVEIHPFTFTDRRVGEQLFWPRAIGKSDLFFSPHYNSPVFWPGNMVATIHDLIPVTLPSKLSGRVYANFMFPITVRKAKKIIAISHSTKQDLMDVLEVHPDKIEVIHHGKNECFQRIADEPKIKAWKATKGLDGHPMILYVGTKYPHKNLNRLVQAFEQVLGQIPEARLVFCGKDFGYRNQELYETISRLKLSDKIIDLGQVSFEDLIMAYNCADVLAFVSLYEGFGFPLLEAMGCGTPVVCSNVSSLPEIGADAVKLIDPYDIEQMSAALLQVLSREDVALTMRAKGLERCQMFNWEKTAQKTMDVFLECM